jgi:hypothetical protein
MKHGEWCTTMPLSWRQCCSTNGQETVTKIASKIINCIVNFFFYLLSKFDRINAHACEAWRARGAHLNLFPDSNPFQYPVSVLLKSHVRINSNHACAMYHSKNYLLRSQMLNDGLFDAKTATAWHRCFWVKSWGKGVKMENIEKYSRLTYHTP